MPASAAAAAYSELGEAGGEVAPPGSLSAAGEALPAMTAPARRMAGGLAGVLLLVVGACCAQTYAQRQAGPWQPQRARALATEEGRAGSGPQLSVNNTTLQGEGAWLEVSWQGVAEPSLGDAVALSVPLTDNYSAVPPAKFQWASQAPGHLANGSGSLVFRVLNHRADLRFLLVTAVHAWAGNFTVLAQSAVVAVAAPNAPTQGHLALTGTSGEVLVQWTTRDEGRLRVRYGPAAGGQLPQQLPSSAEAQESVTYARREMCGGEAKGRGYMDPGHFHRATLRGLQPSTTYTYSYGSEEDGYSAPRNFTTGPEIGSEETVSLLAIADLGFCEPDGSMTRPFSYPNPLGTAPLGTEEEVRVQVNNVLHMGWVDFCASASTTRRMAADMPGRTLVVHNGDISYAEGFVYGWDVFMDQMGPIIGAAPYMVTQGNHERDWPGTGTRFDYPPARDSGGECGVATARRFPMPSPGGGQEWYAFDHGPIHFLQLASELDFAPGSPQYAFILEDLKGVNRSRTPWVVAGFHRPFYTDSVYGNSITGDVGFTEDIRAALERVFFQFQVDQTWFGHVHAYSRTCPVLQRNCLGYNEDGSAKAPVHLLIGHAGAPYSWSVNPETPPYYEAVAIAHGYLRVSANRTTMAMEAVNSLDGSITDAFVLRKPPGWRPDPQAQLRTLALLHTNYTPSWSEVSGVSSAAEELILGPAEALLFSEPELLARLRNATLVKAPLSYDTLASLDEIFEPLNRLYAEEYADSRNVSAAAHFYYRNYFKPLFRLFREHQDGVLKRPARARL